MNIPVLRKISFWMSVLFLFLVPWENVVIIPGLGTLTKISGILLMGLWLGTIVITNSARRLRPIHIVAVLFVLWNAMTVMWSLELRYTLIRLQTYVQLMLLLFLLWDLYVTRIQLRAGLQAYIFGTYVAIFSIYANFFSGNVTQWEKRATLAGTNENDIGLIMCIGIPIAWYLATNLTLENRWKPLFVIINYLYIPAAMMAIVFTASRGSLLASLPGLAYIFSTFSQFRPVTRVVVFVALVSTAVAVVPFVPQSAVERFSTIGSQVENRDLGGRVGFWDQGIAAFYDHPVFGIGTGAFPVITESHHPAHNIYLSVLVETGLIGFSLFSCVLLLVIYRAFQQPKSIGRMWLAALGCWTIGVLALTWEYEKMTWILFILVIISANIYREPASQETPQPLPNTPPESFGLPART